MKKLLIRFFLSLCIILLSGYSQLYAHTYQDGIRHSSIKALLKSEHAGIGKLQNTQALPHKFSSSVTENLKLSVAEIEEEDDELVSFKKLLEHSNYFTAVFYALVFGCLGLFLLKRLPAGKHALYFSSFKLYLLFRVIRIWFKNAGWQIAIA